MMKMAGAIYLISRRRDATFGERHGQIKLIADRIRWNSPISAGDVE